VRPRSFEDLSMRAKEKMDSALPGRDRPASRLLRGEAPKCLPVRRQDQEERR
jgi:hypothetical protein